LPILYELDAAILPQNLDRGNQVEVASLINDFSKVIVALNKGIKYSSQPFASAHEHPEGLHFRLGCNHRLSIAYVFWASKKNSSTSIFKEIISG